MTPETPLTPVRLAIMGGCLNTGFNLVPLNSLYHRIMVKDLQTRLKVPVRVHLGRMESNQPCQIKAAAWQLREKCQAEVLVLQLRPELLWGLFSLCWLTRSGSGLKRIRRNPHWQFGGQAGGWPDGVEASLTPMLHSFTLLNLWLGRVRGLGAHGTALLTELILSLRDTCHAQGIDFLLISPIFGEIYHPAFQAYVKERILPKLELLGVPSIDLLGSAALRQPSCWVGDGYHLNAAGHQEVGRLAAEALDPILHARIAKKLATPSALHSPSFEL